MFFAKIMGVSIIVSSIMSFLVKIHGHRGMVGGKDLVLDPETGKTILDENKSLLGSEIGGV